METRFHGLGAGASIGGYVGPAEQQAIRQEPALSAVVSTMDEAVRLAQRVSSIVDRLCGAVTSPAGQDIKDRDFCSIFDGLRGQADKANSQIQDAMAALSRLDRELP